MSTISRRVDTTIKHLKDQGYENALIQVCIAIDATAKRKWPSYKPGKRIRNFVEEYEAFIYQFASAGGIMLEGTGNMRGKIVFPGGELPGILYKSVRCVLHHGDELSHHLVIEKGNTIIGVDQGRIVMNEGFIDGLLFSVVSDKVNEREFCDSLPTYAFSGSTIKINEVWGKVHLIEKLTGCKKVF